VTSPVAGLLGESFAVLAAELPAAHARMCARLAGRRVDLRVDGERFVAAFDGGQASVRACAADEEPAADVRVVTGRGAILAVIDAERSLAEAVIAGEVHVVGDLDRLVEAHLALVAYVHGAVRCPSFPALLGRFRAMKGVSDR
jgi:hypothetical protein